MVRPKVSAETVVRDAIAVVATTLVPGAVVGFPVLRAMLPPRALLNTRLFLCASRSLVAPPLFSPLLLVALLWPLFSLRLLLLWPAAI